ncbi:hypothetical protein NHG28_06535 [Aerococcaceae bacterium NML201209]|nr:hypothetical protein [Aerococcaceae bacterium NML201209]
MSKKALIYNTLKSLELPLAYRDSNLSQLPRLNYSLVGNYSIRASGKRHTQVSVYQVDYFSDIPIDVESDTLMAVTLALENVGLHTSDWREVHTIDEAADTSVYHYYIEVK